MVDKMLDSLGGGNSPVKGESFKRLDKDYARREKGGNRTPNLNLDGDLWDAITSEADGNNLIIGVDADEEGKSEGHNQLIKGEKHPLPKRRFIPSDSQKFKSPVNRLIQETLSLFTEDISKVVNEVKRVPLVIPRVELKLFDQLNITRPVDAAPTRPFISVGVEGPSEELIKSIIEGFR